MTEKKVDPMRTARFERAIAEKYGEETVQNPKAKWNQELEASYLRQRRDKVVKEKDVQEELVEINGVFIPKKLVTKTSDRTCPVCDRYSFSMKDDTFMAKFGVCETCFIEHIEDREDKWEQKKEQLSEEQKLEELVRSELQEMVQSGELDEGLISTLIARTTGAKAGLAQLGKNVAVVYRALAKGQSGVLKNPKVVKNVTTAITRIKTYEKKFQKIMFDLVADLEFMFGNDFEAAPEIEDFLNELDELSTKFAGDLGRLADTVKTIMTNGSQQGGSELGGQDLAQGLKSPAGLPQASSDATTAGKGSTVAQRSGQRKAGGGL